VGRIRIHLKNLVHEVSGVSDAAQSRVEIRLLVHTTGASGQIQADKTCVQRLANIAGCLARAAGPRPKIVRVPGNGLPVVFDDRLHEPVVFPAGHASACHMDALRVIGGYSHFHQRDRQTLVDQEFQERLPQFMP